MLYFGSGDPTRAICSTMIAQAFQAIPYPILPHIERVASSRRGGRRRFREILRLRHYSLFTPRDFDISPFFAIVKPRIEAGFDYRSVEWATQGAAPSV